MKTSSQRGSAHVVVTICLVIALLFALGWIFWQNFVHKESTKKDTDVIVVDKNKADANKTDTDTSSKPVYHDYRKNKQDTTGVSLKSASDVDKLTGASDKLKTYFKENVGKSAGKDPTGAPAVISYTVDRVYGDYAAGSGMGAYFIWGPKNGTGAITNVSGTQNLGFKCSELESAKVPSKLVDGRCYAYDGSSDGGPQAYNQDYI